MVEDKAASFDRLFIKATGGDAIISLPADDFFIAKQVEGNNKIIIKEK